MRSSKHPGQPSRRSATRPRSWHLPLPPSPPAEEIASPPRKRAECSPRPGLACFPTGPWPPASAGTVRGSPPPAAGAHTSHRNPKSTAPISTNPAGCSSPSPAAPTRPSWHPPMLVESLSQSLLFRTPQLILHFWLSCQFAVILPLFTPVFTPFRQARANLGQIFTPR
jgi:hypothetical protein